MTVERLPELTVRDLDFYAGLICEACEEGDACITDTNGLHLCAACAEGCRLPTAQA